MNKAENEFAAPMGTVTAGRLEFARGAGNLTIRAGASTDDLYRARFEGTAPDVRVEDGAVTVDYPWTWRLPDWGRHSADIVLNKAVPWSLEVRGGAARIETDFEGLRLDSFKIDGGVSDVELTLPEPSGTVSVRIKGGANDLRVRRPKGVAARLRVAGGARELALDAQRLGAVGGDTTLESGDYAGATDRYEITVTGGANDVSVGAS